MPNPSGFILEYDAPFNFGMTTVDWDAFFHSSKNSGPLRLFIDPCTWSEGQKAYVDSEAAEWMAKWDAWCKHKAGV